MSSPIEPIDGSRRIVRLERVRPSTERRRPEEQEHEHGEPREREPDEREESAGGGLIDVRI